MGLNDVQEFYDALRRIPTYVFVIMVFTVLQFLVVSSVSVFGVVQLRRIAEVMATSQPPNNQTWASGQPPIPPGYGQQQQPPQYGPRHP